MSSSPFPGMDPYIEARDRWPDFHHGFISECRAAINAGLPENYVATINERVQTIALADGGKRVSLPDLSVNLDPDRAPRRRESSTGGGTAVATLEPQTLPQSVQWLDEPTEGYIEIFRLPDFNLVTGVEVLSPSNKVNPGRATYLAKRLDLLHHGVNLVEVDLLRRGQRIPLLAPLPAGDYYTFVTRWESFDQCDVYAWSVRRALPTVAIPLKPADPDVKLDLAAVFATTYDVGRYRRVLRYEKPVDLSLDESDVAWAADQASRAPS